MSKNLELDGKALLVTGRVVRCCRLRDEYYQFVGDPAAFVSQMKSSPAVRADLFTFIQEIPERAPRFHYYQEWDRAAVLPLTSFDQWWKKQVNDKTRNMVRKAQKAGVEIRLADFNEELVRGIERIYNECPIRQGRPFKHYGKPFPIIWQEHATFLEQSQFVGAYHSGHLIGFLKLVHGHGISNLMNIVSLISERNKAPTNALIAKAVEICTSRGVPYLQYGTGNAGTIGDFKKHHAFEEFLVPRYVVPLNVWGAAALKLGLHRRIEERIPETWRSRLLQLRNNAVAFRFRNHSPRGPVVSSAERSAQA